MSLFESIQAKLAVDRLDEESSYAIALREIESGMRRDGIWAKALADSGMNEQKAAALYIRRRVQSMKDERVLHAQQAQNAAMQAAREMENNIRLTLDKQLKAQEEMRLKKLLKIHGRFLDIEISEAVWNGNWATVKALLEHGTNPHGCDKDGRTLVDLASVRGDNLMLKLLRKYVKD